MIELKLNPTHISLYNALFLIWNECGFEKELSINRNDMMKMAKIGSANTYTKCLKDLDKFKLLKYKPSYNPLIGSVVNLYRFDKGNCNSIEHSTRHGIDKGSDDSIGNSTDDSIEHSIATLYKLLNLETYKLLNKETIKQLKHINTSCLKFFKREKEPKVEKVFSEEVLKCYENCLPFFDENLKPDSEPKKNKWLDTIDKLNRIDKIPFKWIEKITKAARNDSWWSSNFLSLNKLRNNDPSGVKYIIVFHKKFFTNGREQITDYKEYFERTMQSETAQNFSFD